MISHAYSQIGISVAQSVPKNSRPACPYYIFTLGIYVEEWNFNVKEIIIRN